MIESIIEKIHKAEEDAENIRAASMDEIRRLEADNQHEIERLRESAAAEIKDEIKFISERAAAAGAIEAEEYVRNNQNRVAARDLNNKKEEAKNSDLWERLLSLAKTHMIKMHWIKGHADNEYNNRCDKLAVEYYKRYFG